MDAVKVFMYFICTTQENRIESFLEVLWVELLGRFPLARLGWNQRLKFNQEKASRVMECLSKYV